MKETIDGNKAFCPRSVAEAVLEHSKTTPDKLAAADADKAYTYLELAQAAGKAAQLLGKLSVEAGDYAVIECTQETDYLVLKLGCELAGVVFVPVEKKMTESRVQAVYEETKAKCIIGKTDYSQMGRFYSFDEVMKQIAEMPDGEASYTEKNTVSEILFSTGTTGQPKGIVISHRANIAIAENIKYGTEMKEDSVELIPLPLSHSHGLRTCYANLLNGSSVVVMDGVMNVKLFFSLVDKYNVNAFDISPTLAKVLLKIARKGLVKYSDAIDYIEIGTAVLDDEVKNQLKDIFTSSRLYNFYGSTEAGRSCVLDFNKMDFTGCIGYPSKNAVFYVVDDDRKEIKSSKENPGLIAVSGRMMMDCYFNSEELTKETLTDGILYSNDLGYIDEAGRVYVMGRQDDIINYKGIKIAPEEIEVTAVQYKGIVDCACVPVADAVRGQVPKLFIQLSKGAAYDENDYLNYLKQNLEAARVPVYIEVIDNIPRSSNGKLQRKKLRENEK